MSYIPEPAMQSCDTDQLITFWQLSIVNNTDVQYQT